MSYQNVENWQFLDNLKVANFQNLLSTFSSYNNSQRRATDKTISAIQSTIESEKNGTMFVQQN